MSSRRKQRKQKSCVSALKRLLMRRICWISRHWPDWKHDATRNAALRQNVESGRKQADGSMRGPIRYREMQKVLDVNLKHNRSVLSTRHSSSRTAPHQPNAHPIRHLVYPAAFPIPLELFQGELGKGQRASLWAIAFSRNPNNHQYDSRYIRRTKTRVSCFV